MDEAVLARLLGGRGLVLRLRLGVRRAMLVDGAAAEDPRRFAALAAICTNRSSGVSALSSKRSAACGAVGERSMKIGPASAADIDVLLVLLPVGAALTGATSEPVCDAAIARASGELPEVGAAPTDDVTRPLVSMRVCGASSMSNCGATNTVPGAASASACRRSSRTMPPPVADSMSSDCGVAPAKRASQRSAHATCCSVCGCAAIVAVNAFWAIGRGAGRARRARERGGRLVVGAANAAEPIIGRFVATHGSDGMRGATACCGAPCCWCAIGAAM